MSRLSAMLADHCLCAGGVIAYPTEAVWGLGCDPFNISAVERLLTLKRRSLAQGLILVAANTGQIAPLLANLSAKQVSQLESTWPGPVTWLIPDPDNLFPLWIKGRHSSVAIRVSRHDTVRELCEQFGSPIVSTSANISNRREIRSRIKLQRTLGKRVDYVVTGTLGDSDKPSRIIDLISGETLR